MARKRKIEPFYLIMVDHDKKMYNVIGPISDDSDWNKKIVELQNKNRKVNCFSVSGSKSFENIISSYSEQTSYVFSQQLIFTAPEDHSMEYKGSLPNYAQKADRKKLIRIFCKSDCNKTRWAEMNVNYPGNETLSNSDLGDFNAVCLKCGKVAKDSYNWFR